MADLYHNYGEDLVLSANGDLLLTPDISTETTQRVLRRLMTNPGADLWRLDYGAGLGGFVGQPLNAARLKSIVLRQMRLEAGVSQSPPPTVAVTANTTGTFIVDIKYTDAGTGQTVLLTLPQGLF